MKKEYRTQNEAQTIALAESFAKNLSVGDVVCLNGELGSGKTVFSKGLCSALGVTEHISSPTFTIVNEYEGDRLTIYHFDMYRIEDSGELVEIGFDEYLSNENALCLIEWSINVKDALPKKRIEIKIQRDLSLHEDARIITIEELC